ncbi:choline/carnitine O-acyltransferase [Candidatus Enterococcus clewellii]|uniref:Carnitine O-acetyltransferase n=1 Tax=Candidatus Enterococcus clewellii TaxID=1834193 RepID=A0A242K2F9_9ENTE|nr:choline/carnitine O-acyltransferase [Enterococcus sp. 9E7_DIV0242]OTP12778.1 hypothetical protein A5888_003357 [Enterococcus sp. 9E7_DIV0242]
MKKYKEELLPLLGKLPVPELTHTMSQLVEWAAPFLTDLEQRDFEKIVKQFSTNEGLKLQERLELHWQETEGSWLADFWQESYLNGRGYVQSETNFGLVIQDEAHRCVSSRAEKAAQLIYQLTKIYLAFVEESYPLEFAKNKQHVDMSYYENFFGSCRTPTIDKDLFFKNEQANNYVLILNEGNYYQLEVIDSSGNLHSLKSILENINYILAVKQPALSGERDLAYLFGVDRSNAYQAYQQLNRQKENAENCQLIETALFILSFTDGKDETVEERVATMLLNGQDQIFTKTLQALITKNGSIGFNIEHTAVDGVPTMNLLAKVFDAIKMETLVTSQRQETSLINRLSWQFSPELLEMLVRCRRAVEEEAAAYSIHHRTVDGIGKNVLKELKISPDAYFHMALAVAQKDVFGCLKSVYEPVAMRGFYGGRTECARSLSTQKKIFSEAFLNKEKAFEKAELTELFLDGIAAHSKRLVKCQKGLGVERHLFGLQKMVPDSLDAAYFFQSEAIKKLTRNFLSTTGIPSDLLESFSFCPVDQEGFGLYYGILEDRIVLTISSKKEQREEGKLLIQQLEFYLLDLLKLFNQTDRE